MRRWSIDLRRVAGFAAATVLVLIAADGVAARAAASPPLNDEPNFIVVRDLPYADWLDTSGATVQPLDPPCHDSAATVWYTVVGDGNPLLLETTGSDYDTTLSVYLGGGQLACADDGADGSAQATVSLDSTVPGYEYYVMIGAARGGPGGLLHFVARRPFDAVPDLPPPPPNDTLAGATPITSLPATFTEGVAGADDSSDDPPYCGTWYSVWFTYTPVADDHVVFDTMGSDYDTELGVYTPTSPFPVACNEDALGTTQSRVEIDVQAGRTYQIQVSAQFRFGPPEPGTLVFHADRIVPFTVSATIESARLNGGAVIVSGTMTCSRPANAGVFVELTQTRHKQTAHGSGSGSLTCDGTGHFDAFVYPDAGSTFVAGSADYVATPQGDSLDVHAESTVTGTVRIRR
jgi:hypothetical protein